MQIKSITFQDGGFMTQQWAVGGEDADGNGEVVGGAFFLQVGWEVYFDSTIFLPVTSV